MFRKEGTSLTGKESSSKSYRKSHSLKEEDRTCPEKFNGWEEEISELPHTHKPGENTLQYEDTFPEASGT